MAPFLRSLNSTFFDERRSGHVAVQDGSIPDKCQLAGGGSSDGATSGKKFEIQMRLALEEGRVAMWRHLRVAPTMPCGRREEQGTCGAISDQMEKAEFRICAT